MLSIENEKLSPALDLFRSISIFDDATRRSRSAMVSFNTMKFFIFISSLIAVIATANAADRPVYLDRSQSVETRVDDLLARLTLEEKVAMVHAKSTFAVEGAARLGVPELWMDDGPMGVREEVGEGFRNLNRGDDFATAMPATIGLAATFNPELAMAYGGVIGQEAKQRNKNIMLGPSLNIQRTPLCGRNFEYMGEDPFLTARIAVNYIKGEQAEGVASCAKHFAANNQENQRSSINVEMDERTLREIYLPAFRACVQEAGVLSVMGAYNLFRGEHCCENDYLLNKVLKNEWGFKGVVMSDWSGVHSTDLAAMNGMDLEMGTRPPYTNNYLANPFLAGLNSGKFPMAVLDDKVRRHLYVMFKLDMIYDPATPPANPEGKGVLSTKAHQEVARRVASSPAKANPAPAPSACSTSWNRSPRWKNGAASRSPPRTGPRASPRCAISSARRPPPSPPPMNSRSSGAASRPCSVSSTWRSPKPPPPSIPLAKSLSRTTGAPSKASSPSSPCALTTAAATWST